MCREAHTRPVTEVIGIAPHPPLRLAEREPKGRRLALALLQDGLCYDVHLLERHCFALVYMISQQLPPPPPGAPSTSPSSLATVVP